MRSFFISIMNDRLLVISNPAKMRGDWPSLYDKSKMEQIVNRQINWNDRSVSIDLSAIFGKPMEAVTFELFEDLYSDAITDPIYDESELIEIALNIFAGPQGIA